MSPPYWQRSSTYLDGSAPCLRETVPAYRVRRYRGWIAAGWFPDMRSAHAWDRETYHKQIVALRVLECQRWKHKQWTKQGKAFRFHRALVLAWPRRCVYCGARGILADHVIPQSRGGVDHFDNLAPACKRCNSEKGARTPQEWKVWRLDRGRSWPPPGAIWTPDKMAMA